MLEGYLESVINLDVIDTGFGALIIWNVSEIAIGSNNSVKESEEKLMHDIDKPITLEDLTNPDKK